MGVPHTPHPATLLFGFDVNFNAEVVPIISLQRRRNYFDDFDEAIDGLSVANLALNNGQHIQSIA